MLKRARKKKTKGAGSPLPGSVIGSAVQFESSSDEDDKIWDDRWVRDENEEEERRIWEEKHKQLQSTKHQQTRAKGRPGGSAKSDDESSSSYSRSSRAIRKKTRKRSDSSDLVRSPSGDTLTTSEEIKTSEEEEDPTELYKHNSESPALNLLTSRSLSSETLAPGPRTTRSMSMTGAPMRDWNSDPQMQVPAVTVCASPKYQDKVVRSMSADSELAEADEMAEDERQHWDRLEAKTPVSRLRSTSVGGEPSVYSPVLTKRRRALTPQRATRPFIKTAGVTFASDIPPSGGGNGEEECLEWKPLWKAD